jgi:hypothetical protein
MPVQLPTQCVYIRTSWLLHAEATLVLPGSSRIRFFDEVEAAKFAETMRRRNVVARIGGTNNHYRRQASELSNRTIIEVLRVGNPVELYEQGESVARLIEKLTILSTTLFLQRKDLLRKLGLSENIMPEVNFTVTRQFGFIRSQSHRVPTVTGIVIDEKFCKRFLKCGFNGLFEYCLVLSDLAKRVKTSSEWLFESRRETRITAAVVKTAIALESLLIFSESESLARTLSERAAFILSPSPEARHEISRVIGQFYDVRSGVVHGSQKKAKKLTSGLIECVDRLILLLHLVISANPHLWPDVDALRVWCETQRWGRPSSDVIYPFSRTYLSNALALIEVN